MFALVMYRNILQSSFRRLSTCVTNKCNGRMKSPCCILPAKGISIMPNDNFTDCRSYSNEPETQQGSRSSGLMDFPVMVWPNWFKLLRNVLITNFVIKQELDSDFNSQEFNAASKQALHTVTTHLANSAFENLVGLVTDDSLKVLKENIKHYSLEQREKLLVALEDITYSFIYEINVIRKYEEDIEKKFVEITMIYHVMHDYERYLEDLKNPIRVANSPKITIDEINEKIFIWNCRFIRNYTKDVDDSWMVNMINYCRPGAQ